MALCNGKLQVTAIKEFLATDKLSLRTINGDVPITDADGYITETYTPGSTVAVKAVPKPGASVATAYAHAVPKSRLLSVWT